MKMGRLNTNSIVGLIAIAAVAACVIWYQQRVSGTDDAADTSGPAVVLQPVRVMPVSKTQSAMMPQRYTATVVARRTSQLAFQATERINEIFFDEGDKVAKGQLLARQDQAALRAQYNAAVARSKQTSALLAELEKGPRPETVEAARADFERLQAQSQLAQSNYRRQASLRKNRASSDQDFDAAKFDFAAAQAATAAAKQKLDELVVGTRKEQIDAQRGALGEITASINLAKTRLDQTELFAPFAGRISQRFVDEGSLPQPGSPVLEIIETDQLEVRFGVSPSIASQLSPGDVLSFSADDKICQGPIKQIQPMLDRATRTRQVIVSVTDAEDSCLVDGQTVSVEFAIQSDEPGFWIPTEALQPQVRGLWSVMVANGSPGDPEASGEFIAQRRDVEVLATWGTWSRVRGTLEESDRVVVEGGSRISSGQLVSTTVSQLELPWQHEKTVKLGSLKQQGAIQ